MDPNAALAYIDRHAKERTEAVADHLYALRNWLRAGGFQPAWTKYPHGTARFVKTYGLVFCKEI